jgi:hypothetical protein
MKTHSAVFSLLLIFLTLRSVVGQQSTNDPRPVAEQKPAVPLTETPPVPFPPGIEPSALYIAGKEVIVTWSEPKDVVWAFSKKLGKWTKQEFDPPATGMPIVGDSVVVWQVGSNYYAFSGESGRWDVLRLKSGRSPKFSLQDYYAIVNDGEEGFIFANSSGRWSSPKDEVNANDSAPPESDLKVVTLRHARPADAERIVNQLFARELNSLAADERSNALIVRAPAKVLAEIEALIVRLDKPAAEPAAWSAADKAAPQPPPTWQSSTGLSHSELDKKSREELQELFNSKERQSALLSREIQQLQATQPVDKQRIEKLTADLRAIVTESFAAGQYLRHKENFEIQQRAVRIWQTLENRFKIADQIIDRRVKDLLNPDLQWENAQTSTAEPASARPKVSYGVWHPDAEKVFTALGLKVRPLSDDELTSPKDRNLLKITEILPGSPADRLQVGDLIVALQTTGGPNKSTRAQLEIRRDKETHKEQFPVLVEFPSLPSSSDDGRPALQTEGRWEPSASSSVADLTAARAYRDKLRERWQAIEQLFDSGRWQFDDMVRSAKELGEAELAAAASPNERRDARQQYVDRLKTLKSYVDDRFENDVEPIQTKLAMDATLLKAEAELAAEKRKTQSESQPSPSAWPPTKKQRPQGDF